MSNCIRRVAVEVFPDKKGNKFFRPQNTGGALSESKAKAKADRNAERAARKQLKKQKKVTKSQQTNDSMSDDSGKHDNASEMDTSSDKKTKKENNRISSKEWEKLVRETKGDAKQLTALAQKRDAQKTKKLNGFSNGRV